MDLQQGITLIVRALHFPEERAHLIDRFQQMVWHDAEGVEVDWIQEVLQNLAYDLDFYQPDPEIRKEDSSYYGDDRLELEIRTALERLRLGGVPISGMDQADCSPEDRRS